MLIFLKRIFSSYLLCLVCLNLQAQEIVSLDKFESPLNVASCAIYIDTSLTFEQVIQLPNSEFKKIKTRDFGKNFMSNHEYWIKFPIRYSGNVDVKRVLTSAFSRIDTVTYFLTRGDSIFQQKKGGNSISHLNNDYNYSYPLFELSLPPNFEGVLYIHLKPKSFVFFPMEFWEPKALAFNSLNKQFEEGLIIGSLSLFFISVIVFAFIFKENYFWFYSLYIFSLLIYLSSYHGNVWNRLGIELDGLHNVMFDSLVASCFMLFNRSFFNLKEKHPLADKLIQIFIFIAILSFILQAQVVYLSSLLFDIKTVFHLFNILGTFVFNVFITIVAYKSYKENKQTRYLWIFFSILIFSVSSIFVTLYLLGLNNPGNFLYSIVPTLNIIETTVLFGVIALDYFEIRSKKNKVDMALALEKQNALGNLVRGAEQERERLASELHEGVGGILVALKMQFGQFKSNLSLEESNRFKTLLDQSTKEIKNISYNLMPGSISLTSLTESLEQLCQIYRIKNGPTIEFYAPNWDDNLSKEHKFGIYRIVQELLKNTIEHSEAKEVIVQISKYGQRIHLIVEDNGIGFEESEVQKGLGLNNIRNRLSYLNGKLEIDSYLNKGTTFNIVINLPTNEHSNN